MGLDMYLNASRYLSSFNEEEKRISQAISQVIGIEPESEDFNAFGRVKNVTFEAGYWRKANAIHKWFVDNVQEGKDECQEAYVEREQLKELRDLCQEVLDHPRTAAKKLPTQSGFFFGATTYDADYKSDLRDTIKIIDKALALPEDWEFHYRSSW